MLLLIRERMRILEIDRGLAGNAEVEKWSRSRTPMRTLPVLTPDLEDTVGGKRGGKEQQGRGNRMRADFNDHGGQEKDERDAGHREPPESPPERRRRDEPDEVGEDCEDEDGLEKRVQGIHG